LRSMHNPNRDKFENFLRESIDQDSLGSWNDPGQLPFNNAMEIIERDERKKRAFFFNRLTKWFLLGLFISTLVLVVFKLNQVSSDLDIIEEEVIQLKEQKSSIKKTIKLDQVIKESEAVKPQLENEELVQDEKPIVNINDRIRVEEKDVLLNSLTSRAAKENSNYSNQEFVNRNDVDNESLGVHNSSSVISSTHNSKFVKDDNSQESKHEKLLALNKIDQKKSTILNWTRIIKPIKFEDSSSNNIPSNTKESTLRFSVLWTNKLTSFGMSNLGNMPTGSLTQYDKYYYSNGIQIGVEKNLSSNFSLQLGLGYSKISNRSTYSNSSKMDMDNVTILTNGDYLYDDELHVETPLNTLKSNYSLSMDASTMDTENGINTISSNSICLDLLTASIGSAYYFNNSKKLTPFISYNLNFNTVLKGKNRMDVELDMDNNLLDSFTFESELKNEISNQFLSHSVLFGCDYELNKNQFLRLAFGYSHSLGAINKSENPTTPKTSYSQYNIGLGYIQNF